MPRAQKGKIRPRAVPRLVEGAGFYDLSWLDAEAPVTALADHLRQGHLPTTALLTAVRDVRGSVEETPPWVPPLAHPTGLLVRHSRHLNYAAAPGVVTYPDYGAGYLRGDNLVLLVAAPSEPVLAYLFYFFHINQAEWGGVVTIDGTAHSLSETNFVVVPVAAGDHVHPQVVTMTFSRPRTTLSGLRALTSSDLAAEVTYLDLWREAIAERREDWYNERAERVAAFEELDLEPEVVRRLGPATRTITGRDLVPGPTFEGQYRAHLDVKLANGEYGLHPHLRDLNARSHHYTRSEPQPGIVQVDDLAMVTASTGMRTHRFNLARIGQVLATAMQDNDPGRLDEWVGWVILWLDYPFPYGPGAEPPDPAYPGIQDLEQEMGQELVNFFRQLGTLRTWYPGLYARVPTKLILAVIFRFCDRQLPAYLAYTRTNPQNWRYVAAPQVLTYAYLLDEWEAGLYCWARALEEVEVSTRHIALPDGVQTQQDPWYHFMIFHMADVIPLLVARRRLYPFLPPHEHVVLRDGLFEEEVMLALRAVSAFLRHHTQEHGRYPEGARIDGRSMVGTLFWDEVLNSGPGGHPELLRVMATEATGLTESRAFPHGGFYYLRRPGAVGFFFNSPRPGASEAFRSRFNNNFFTLALEGHELLRSNARIQYDYVLTPVLAQAPDGRFCQQDFHVGVAVDPDVTRGHKGFLVNAWPELTPAEAPVRCAFQADTDFLQGTYVGSWVPLGGTQAEALTGWHRRRVLHDHLSGIWVILDQVGWGPEPGEGGTAGRQQLWLPPGTSFDAGDLLRLTLNTPGATFVLRHTSPRNSLWRPSSDLAKPLLIDYEGELFTAVYPAGTPLAEVEAQRERLEAFDFGSDTVPPLPALPTPGYHLARFPVQAWSGNTPAPYARWQPTPSWADFLTWNLAAATTGELPADQPGGLAFYRLVMGAPAPGAYWVRMPARYGYLDQDRGREIRARVNRNPLAIYPSSGGTQPFEVLAGTGGPMVVDVAVLTFLPRNELPEPDWTPTISVWSAPI